MSLDNLQRQLPDRGQVQCGDAPAGEARVLVESDVEMPVELVLDAPVPVRQHRAVGRLRIVLIADVVPDAHHRLVPGGDRRGNLDNRPHVNLTYFCIINSQV